MGEKQAFLSSRTLNQWTMVSFPFLVYPSSRIKRNEWVSLLRQCTTTLNLNSLWRLCKTI